MGQSLSAGWTEAVMGCPCGAVLTLAVRLREKEEPYRFFAVEGVYNLLEKASKSFSNLEMVKG